jgi:hypothetical protein
MSTSAVESATRSPDDLVIHGGSDRLPALRTDLDRLLDLADEFEGRAPSRAGSTGPPDRALTDLLPVPVPAPPAPAGAPGNLAWVLVACVGLLTVVAAGVIASAWVERWFGSDDGPRLVAQEELGPATGDVRAPDAAETGPDADAGEDPASAPGEDGGGAEEPSTPASVDPASCGAADLLGAAQAVAPDVPLALTDKRCDGGYAFVGLTGAPVEGGPPPVPPAWAVFRFDEGSWQRLSGGFSVDGWVDVCRATVWGDPAFPLALCG